MLFVLSFEFDVISKESAQKTCFPGSFEFLSFVKKIQFMKKEKKKKSRKGKEFRRSNQIIKIVEA